eukprot:9500241-Pyramimonas_sp.AAC.1
MLELQPVNESKLEWFQILEVWLMTRRRLRRGAVGSLERGGPWLRIYERTTCQSSPGTLLEMILDRLPPLGRASRHGASPRLVHAATNASLPGGCK